MSKPAKILKELLLKQLEGKMLFTTSANAQFLQEFCTDGLVIGPLGQILFSGALEDAVQWADLNLGRSDALDSENDGFEIKFSLSNSEATIDNIDF